ncbi:hypothetical protein SMICM304S_03704 [Streptomyces microflavus]
MPDGEFRGLVENSPFGPSHGVGGGEQEGDLHLVFQPISGIGVHVMRRLPAEV